MSFSLASLISTFIIHASFVVGNEMIEVICFVGYLQSHKNYASLEKL